MKPVACGIGAFGVRRSPDDGLVHEFTLPAEYEAGYSPFKAGSRAATRRRPSQPTGLDVRRHASYRGIRAEHVRLRPRSGGPLRALRRHQGTTHPGGEPVIVLTSVGAKTGKLRKTPLMRVEHDGEYAVVASLGGAPKHPVWYYNLTANPHVELQDGPVKKDYQAREVHGEEYAVWFERAVAAWPDYAEYQKKTTRTMPIFVLTPLDAQQSAP